MPYQARCSARGCRSTATYDGPISASNMEPVLYLVDELGWTLYDANKWLCDQQHVYKFAAQCWRSECDSTVSYDGQVPHDYMAYMTGVLGWGQYEDGRWQCPKHPVTLMPWIFGVLDGLHPAMVAARVGTAHEGHVGWGSQPDGPGTVQCECGEPLDEILTAFEERNRGNEPEMPRTDDPVR